MWWMHPANRDLLRFVDGSCSPRDRSRIAGHLLQCARCRSDSEHVRSVLNDLQALPHDYPRASFGDVRRRLELGERLILPTTAARRAPRPRWSSGAVAAALILVSLALWLAWPAPPLTAGDTVGELTFSPAAPGPGTRVAVEYRPPAFFAQEQRLVLRARFRTPHDEMYNRSTRQVTVAPLTRGRGGAFRGEFTLPPGVVYAVLAVEDTGAVRVDSRDGQLWELLVHDATGAPVRDAMVQQYRDLMSRNTTRALEVMQETSRRFPDDADILATVTGFEQFMLGRSHHEQLLEDRRQALRAMHARAEGDPDVAAEMAAGLFSLVIQVSDRETADLRAIGRHWREWLAKDSSSTPLALTHRIAAITWLDDEAELLAAAERLWERESHQRPLLAWVAYPRAIRSPDASVALRWADRTTAEVPEWSAWVFGELAQREATRDEGIRRLRDLVGRLAARDDSVRMLVHDAARDARARAERGRAARIALAEALLAAGRHEEALSEWRTAVGGGWNVSAFRNAARLEREHGDPARAERLAARVVADPGTPPAVKDSVFREAGVAPDGEGWQRALAEARDLLRRETYADAVTRRVSLSARITSEQGQELPLSELAQGRVTVVTFWSVYCGFSRNQFPALRSLSEQLGEVNAALVAITGNTRDSNVTAFLEEVNAGVPVYFDSRGEARREFNNIRTPTYHVLDARGRLRFVESRLEQVLAQVVVLSGEAGEEREGRTF